jgi:hypothetical protein
MRSGSLDLDGGAAYNPLFPESRMANMEETKAVPEIEFEREGQAPDNWEEQLRVLSDAFANSVVLTDSDYSVRVNALDDGNLLVRK